MVKNLSFRKKLGLFFLLLLLALVMNTYQAIRNYHANKFAWHQAHLTRKTGDIIFQVEQDADHAESAVENFLRTRDLVKGQFAVTLMEGIPPRLEELEKMLVAPNPASIANARAGIERQLRIFRQIQEIYAEIGVNENSGEHGRIREGIHQVEARLSEKGAFEMLSSMLQLRRHEKDLMDRKNILYLEKFNYEVERFYALLNATEGFQSEEKRGIQGLLSQYTRGFYTIASELLAVQQRIEDFRHGIPHVETAMEELKQGLMEIYQTHDRMQGDLLFDQFVRSQMIMITILFLIGAFLAWSQYDILRAVVGLSALAKKVAAGEQLEIVVKRRDEIGELAHSLQVMQGSLGARNRELLDKVLELEGSEKKFAAVIQMADYAIVLVNEDLQVASWNRGAWNCFGYEEAAIIGKPFTILGSRANRGELEQAMRAMGESGKPQRLGEEGMFHCQRSNGELFPATLSLSTWVVDGRRHFSLILRDIGERMASRRQIERALDLRQAIAEIMQQSLLPLTLEEILGRALRIVLAVPWLGLKQSGAIFLYDEARERLEMVVHQALAPRLLTECRSIPPGHCLCGLAVATGEVVMSSRVDERHVILFDGMPPHGHYCVPILSDRSRLGVLNVYLPAGHPFDEEEVVFLRSIASTLAGLIVRRRAERRIMQLSRALEQSPVAIIITDVKGHVEYVNPRFSMLTGYAHEEVAGRNILTLKGEADPLAQAAWGRVMTLGGEWSGALHSRRKGGEDFWEFVSFSPVLGMDQMITNFVFISEDITEKKELEKARDQLLITLDAKVVERTRELKQKIGELEDTRHELIESEKMASLGRLVAGIAHEVNTPIGVAYSASTQLQEECRGIVAMMDQEEVDVDDLTHAVRIVDEASNLVVRNLQRAADLINSFKRASIDHSSEAVREFQIMEIVRDVQMSLRNQFKKSGIEMRVQCPEDLRVVGVPGYLNQILTNLLLNSLLHGFAGGSEAGVITMTFSTDGQVLHFEYRDTGAGMSEETKQKAFEPFFTTNRGAGGSGLGLYILYNLITTKLRGGVVLTSGAGEGVRFVCHWPIQLKNLPAAPRQG
ncbi:MAG: PAS domain S-box protein [Magnetococcales bacterium]|nr:PAS domain S-box protein [Magnetococcales bacterium]